MAIQGVPVKTRHAIDGDHLFFYNDYARHTFDVKCVRDPAATIRSGLPSGTVCDGETSENQTTNVAAKDDDDGGDGDGDPDSDRRRSHSKKSPPSFPPALFGFAPLSHYVGFGRSRIYQLISAGQFPKPIKVGKSSRWIRAEIDSWISHRSHQRTEA